MTVTAQELRNQINAALGTDVLKLGNDPQFKVTYTPTGVLPIDILLQGGIPRGRFIEFYGDYSTLKSYIGYRAIKSYQERKMSCAVIDTEHSWDEAWALSIGIDVTKVIVIRPETGELAMDACEALIRSGIDLILFDSIAATLPQAEQAKRLHGESIQPARQAQLMSAGLRKLTAANTNTSIIFINQTRLSIGVTFGNPESIPGGKAMPFYASYRVDMRKAGKVTRDFKTYDGEKWINAKEQTGQKYKATVTKSKLSKPFREMWFIWDLVNNSIDIPTFCIAQGLELGIIEQKGPSWRFGEFKAQGREKFRDKLAADPEALYSLETAVRLAHDLPALKSPQNAVQRVSGKTTKTLPAAQSKISSRGGSGLPKKTGILPKRKS